MKKIGGVHEDEEKERGAKILIKSTHGIWYCFSETALGQYFLILSMGFVCLAPQMQRRISNCVTD